MPINLSGRPFLRLLDFSTEEIEYLLKLSKNFKDLKRTGTPHRYLEGKNIGVQTGTTGDIYCTGDYGQDHVKQFNNGPLAVAALANGQIDCVVIDQEPAKNYVAANSGLKILDTSYADEDYAIAIKKGNTELLDKVNGALKELGEDGTLQSIVDKYINADAQ